MVSYEIKENFSVILLNIKTHYNIHTYRKSHKHKHTNINTTHAHSHTHKQRQTQTDTNTHTQTHTHTHKQKHKHTHKHKDTHRNKFIHYSMKTGIVGPVDIFSINSASGLREVSARNKSNGSGD